MTRHEPGPSSLRRVASALPLPSINKFLRSANLAYPPPPYGFSRKRSLLDMTSEMPLQALYNEALIGLANGKSEPAVVTELVQKGVPEINARMMAADALRVKRAAFRKAGLQAALGGAGLVALGIIITVATASMNTGFFIVAYGPVIFGGIQMIKGLFRAMVG